MKRELLYFTFFLSICLTLPLTATAQVVDIPDPIPPPFAVREAFELDPFYQQWIDVEGLPVVASAKVNPYAVKEAAWQIRHMIGHRPDVLQALVPPKMRFTVIGYTELLTDIPEYHDQGPDFLTYRYRGIGGSGLSGHPAVSSSEENVLHYPGINSSYNILIHEFAHVVHKFGLKVVDPTFDDRLEIAYNTAMKKGLWQGTYASSDRGEYWAEGTRFWFNPEDTSDEKSYNRTHINTRIELKNYDPPLAALLTEIYGDSGWRYTPPATRTHLPHLQGFDPQDSPMFQGWPELEALYRKFGDPHSDGGDNWVDLRPYHPSLLPSLKESRTAGSPTKLVFMNVTQEEVSVYRVKQNGSEELWIRIPPDLRYIRWRPSKTNHIWLIKDANGRNLAVFLPEQRTGRALIGGTPLITPGLSKISGDNQTGVSGAVLGNPFVVEVRDNNGAALEGISVTFTVAAGSGTLSVTRATTDKNGAAQSTLALGQNLGTNAVSVSAAGIGQPVTFNTVAEAAIDIPDTNLRTVVETALGKADGDPITPSEIAALMSLEEPEAGVRNLTGLEHATNLTYLDFWKSSVSDISPVAGLTNLTHLGFAANNAISDVSALVGLTNLTALWVNGNSISDISPLAGLTKLTRLGLSNNSISDISALAGLTNLTLLKLNHNSILNISSLANLTNLRRLDLYVNMISDPSPVAGLTDLTSLNLAENLISDVSALVNLTNLTYLELPFNSISDLSPLVANIGLGSGDEIDVRGNPLSYQSIHTYIPALQSRGVTVEYDNRAHPALLKISGDNQKGASFVSLPQPFVIEAQDANGSALVGISVMFAVTRGGGTLSITNTRTDENGRGQSTLILGPNLGTNTVQVSATGIRGLATFHTIADTELPPMTADVNNDGLVNVLDLILIASSFGQSGQSNADVNRDGTVSILDLVLAAGMFDGAAAAPSAQQQIPETLTAIEFQGWLTDARALEMRDPIVKRGFAVLEQLLVSLTPKETELLANYPNPFNPETWIPYRLAEDAFVTLTIYDGSGHVVRKLEVGHQIASTYENRSKAIYWDGRNGLGELVTSGVYFYTLTAGDYSATRKMVIRK